MNNVRMNLIPATVGSIAMAWFASQANPEPSEALWSKSSQPIIRYRESSLGTYGGMVSSITQSAVVSDETASLMRFYADLLTNQQELGAEFEKALYDNLWDLYAR